MTIYDEGERIAEPCPECHSRQTYYEPVFGFWKCEECSTVWGDDEDDPDYDEAELCPECKGTRVSGTEGNPDEDLPDQWSDKTCATCNGTGLKPEWYEDEDENLDPSESNTDRSVQQVERGEFLPG